MRPDAMIFFACVGAPGTASTEKGGAPTVVNKLKRGADFGRLERAFTVAPFNLPGRDRFGDGREG
jgi:hypothetical protein